jgi:2-iminoacetate synthase
VEFINEAFIHSLMNDSSLRNGSLQLDIIGKAKEAKGLSLKDSAALLNVTSRDILEELFNAAKEVKEKIFGKRLVVFAPLYITNSCVNNCLYCTFRRDNKDLKRKSLTLEEIEEETCLMVQQGQKRLLLVAGEHPKNAALEFIGKAVEKIYSVKVNEGNIRRVDLNSAPMSVSNFKTLKNFGIGTYHCFQETYDYNTYSLMHPDGPKSDYAWRLYAMDRALQAGIEDVGIGSLFGLTDYRFEALGLLSHALNLDERYGLGPHTISVPRILPALNAQPEFNSPHAVDDAAFKKLVAVLRLAVPYTGILLSTRENAEFRRELLNVGVSQIGTGSRTSLYTGQISAEGDQRSLDEVVMDLLKLGFLPSFCTACCRSERTGDRFMELAKAGSIGRLCLSNSVSSLKEYLLDYASEKTKLAGEDLLNARLGAENSGFLSEVIKMLERVTDGERDVYV